MNNKKSLLLISLLSLSYNAFASDVPINCRNEVVGQKNIYAGTPQCTASYTVTTCKPTGPSTTQLEHTTYNRTLTGPYTESTRDYVLLREWVRYNTNSGAGPGMCTLPKPVSKNIQCSAKLDFLEKRDVEEQVCDYRPTAYLKTNNFSAGEIYIRASGRDKDGTYRVQLFINGVEQDNNEVIIGVYDGYDYGEAIRVESRVTDNDGYTDIKRRWVTIIDTGEINPFPY